MSSQKLEQFICFGTNAGEGVSVALMNSSSFILFILRFIGTKDGQTYALHFIAIQNLDA